jgi:hypothetical protein
MDGKGEPKFKVQPVIPRLSHPRQAEILVEMDRLTYRIYPTLYPTSDDPHGHGQHDLHGYDPALPSPQPVPEPSVYDRTVKQLETVRPRTQAEEGELGVGDVGFEEEGDRTKGQANWDALQSGRCGRESVDRRDPPSQVGFLVTYRSVR